jgi:putative endonuclease
MYFVYFLRSKKKPSWVYVGYTANLERRLAEHSAGLANYTRSYVPLVLDSYIAVETETKAKSLEKYFKTGSGIAVLRKRILNS